MRPTRLNCALLIFTAGTAVSAAPLHFTDVTSTRLVQTIAEISGNEKAIDTGDYDNDGDIDVLVADALSDFGARKNKLYRNDNGVLTEVTASAIPSFAQLAQVSRRGFLRDYNEDGWLDIYIINDANSDPDQLFINQHPGGVFQSFQQIGGLPSGGFLGAACSGSSVDFNNDGHIDVLAANYPNSSQDKLIFNNGAASFTDVTASMYGPESAYSINASAADFNQDGQIDVLITNNGGQAGILHWNNVQNAGSGPGDFSYAGSLTSFSGGSGENTMEAADLNGDGLPDFYWGNRTGNIDRVFENMGVGANGKATFQELTSLVLPPSVSQKTTRKITPADLNSDGRTDLVVMKESAGDNRPTILRNTTVNGVISFVDWTEASAFPGGALHKGWHSGVFDSNGDGDLDIFLGGFNNDFLFEQEPAPTFDAASLTNGVVPGVFNGDATVVTNNGGAKGATNTFIIQNVTAGGFISAIVNGGAATDLTLEVLVNNNVIATSDRGGAGVEEAMEVDNLSAGSVSVRVTAPNLADLNGDSIVNGSDLASLLTVWGPAGAGTGADFNNDGMVDGSDLATLLTNWGVATGSYTLELLARN